MGHIYCILGKSGTGKDTVTEAILSSNDIEIEKIVTYTTRPKRENELEGVNYHYVSRDEMENMERMGQIIEKRSYDTVHGEWIYFTADTDIEEDRDYIVITTQEALEKFIERFGRERIYVIYLKIDDKKRLERCINRESLQSMPNYAEVCRRFISDEKDFDEEKIKSLSSCSFVDTDADINECIKTIKSIITEKR